MSPETEAKPSPGEPRAHLVEKLEQKLLGDFRLQIPHKESAIGFGLRRPHRPSSGLVASPLEFPPERPETVPPSAPHVAGVSEGRQRLACSLPRSRPVCVRARAHASAHAFKGSPKLAHALEKLSKTRACA